MPRPADWLIDWRVRFASSWAGWIVERGNDSVDRASSSVAGLVQAWTYLTNTRFAVAQQLWYSGWVVGVVATNTALELDWMKGLMEMGRRSSRIAGVLPFWWSAEAHWLNP